MPITTTVFPDATSDEAESYEVLLIADDSKVAEVDAIRNADGTINRYVEVGTDTDYPFNAATEKLVRFFRTPVDAANLMGEDIDAAGTAAWSGVTAGKALKSLEVVVNAGGTMELVLGAQPALVYSGLVGISVSGDDVRNITSITMTAGTGRVLHTEAV